MPSFRDCIKLAVKNKEISKLQADLAEAFADQTESQLRKQATEIDIEGKLASLFELKAIRAKQQVAMDALKLQEIIRNIEKSPTTFGTGLLAHITRDPTGKSAFSNVDKRTLAIQNFAYAPLNQTIDKLLPRGAFRSFKQDQVLFKNIMRELHQEASGDVTAKQFAATFKKIFEDLRIRFNKAGGMILPREKWGFTHLHNSIRVKRVPFQEWKQFTESLIDWKATTDELGIPHSTEAIDDMLAASYENITGFGTRDIRGAMKGTRKVANRHQDHRVFQFKSGSAWLEYNEKFGNPDLWNSIQNHIDGMSREIALMEVLGPDPFGQMRRLRAIADQTGIRSDQRTLLDWTWNVVTGKTSTIAKGKYTANIAAMAQGVRNMLGIALLPRAFLTSFSDLWSIQMTRGFDGTQGSVMIKEIVADMLGQRETAKKFSLKNGISALGALERSHGAMRFQDAMGFGWTSKMSDAFHRLTLLSPWTEAGQEAFGREMSFSIGELTRKGWNQIDGGLKDAMKRYGINEADWVKARSAFDVIPGAEELRFFNPLGIDDINIATKFQEMILTEMDIAVPMPDARVRAIITGGRQRGTVTGELIRSVGLFKSFPITLMLTHLGRGMYLADGVSRAKYLAALFGGYTVMGALVRQMKAVSQGRDPEPMASSEFWIAAAATGGGLGFFGDILFQDTGKYGQGATENLLGPVAQVFDDIMDLTKGQLFKVVRGEDTNFWVQANKMRRKYLTPRTWYTDLVFDRLVMDWIWEQIDPNAGKTFRTMEKRLKKDTGQESFWRPGDRLPHRAPKLSAAFRRKP